MIIGRILEEHLRKTFRRHMDLDAIVFIHSGKNYYCEYAIRQAIKTNPDVPVIFITDHDLIVPSTRLVNIPLSSYTRALEKLRRYFINYSSNESEFEYRCFARWFVIHQVCSRLGFRSIFHADSDVLIYQDLKLIYKQFREFDLSVSSACSGHSSFWTAHALRDFCNHIMMVFEHERPRIETWYNQYKLNGAPGGYCDMSCIAEFIKADRIKYAEGTEIYSGFTFDDNINSKINGKNLFRMENGMKKLIWRDAQPYAEIEGTGQLIRFATLHFQGLAKTQIEKVFNGDYYIHG